MWQWQQGSRIRSSSNEFTLGAEIGGGAEGVVFEVAEDRRLLAKIYLDGTPARLDALIPRFQQAFLAPGVDSRRMPVLGLPLDYVREGTDGQDGPAVGIIMMRVHPDIDHAALASFEDREQASDPGFALSVARQIASDVRFFHDAGLIVGDLSPHNILVSLDRRAPQIAWVDLDSFGAVAIDSASGAPVSVSGTPGYRAPEVIQSLSARSQDTDRFSLGVLLIEVLCGFVSPFAVAHAQRIDDDDDSRIVAGDSWLIDRGDYLARRLTHLPPDAWEPGLSKVVLEFLRYGGEWESGRPTAEAWYRALRDLTVDNVLFLRGRDASGQPVPGSVKSSPTSARKRPVTATAAAGGEEASRLDELRVKFGYQPGVPAFETEWTGSTYLGRRATQKPEPAPPQTGRTTAAQSTTTRSATAKQPTAKATTAKQPAAKPPTAKSGTTKSPAPQPTVSKSAPSRLDELRTKYDTASGGSNASRGGADLTTTWSGSRYVSTPRPTTTRPTRSSRRPAAIPAVTAAVVGLIVIIIGSIPLWQGAFGTAVILTDPNGHTPMQAFAFLGTSVFAVVVAIALLIATESRPVTGALFALVLGASVIALGIFVFGDSLSSTATALECVTGAGETTREYVVCTDPPTAQSRAPYLLESRPTL